jgi:hypothetical protein
MPVYGLSQPLQIARQCLDGLPHSREHPLQPDAKVRRLADMATNASDLPPNGQGIVTDGSGMFFEPSSSFMAFEELGTTPTLLAAEAWKISSRFYKSSLLSYLDRPNNGKLALLMNGLVSSWAEKQQRQCAGLQDFSGEDGSISGRPGNNDDGSGRVPRVKVAQRAIGAAVATALGSSSCLP